MASKDKDGKWHYTADEISEYEVVDHLENDAALKKSITSFFSRFHPEMNIIAMDKETGYGEIGEGVCALTFELSGGYGINIKPKMCKKINGHIENRGEVGMPFFWTV